MEKTLGDLAGAEKVNDQPQLAEISEFLKGEYNEDIGDEAGGYRFRFADENAEVTAKIPSRRGKKGKASVSGVHRKTIMTMKI